MSGISNEQWELTRRIRAAPTEAEGAEMIREYSLKVMTETLDLVDESAPVSGTTPEKKP